MNRRKRDKIGSKQRREIRSIERSSGHRSRAVGAPKPSQAILPKTGRKKPKHKKALDQEVIGDRLVGVYDLSAATATNTSAMSPPTTASVTISLVWG